MGGYVDPPHTGWEYPWCFRSRRSTHAGLPSFQRRRGAHQRPDPLGLRWPCRRQHRVARVLRFRRYLLAHGRWAPGRSLRSGAPHCSARAMPSPVPTMHRWKATRTSSRARMTMSSWCCASPAPRGGQTLVFVSAVQDRYALKKSPTSASVGVGALGSKVAGEGGQQHGHRCRVLSSLLPAPAAVPAGRGGQAVAIAGRPEPAPAPAVGPGLSVRGRWLIAALLLAPAWVVAAPSPDCTQGLLQRLGWR